MLQDEVATAWIGNLTWKHARHQKLLRRSYNLIKDPQWYAVQVSDTTMLPRAASLFGQ